MSIVTLIDKSFLQSLSLDEAVMFDAFFIGNVCPTIASRRLLT